MTGKKLALLVIDMQEQFRPMAEEIVKNINQTSKFCRQKKFPVIHTQHGHKNLDADGGALAEFWGFENSIEYGSHEWKLIPELDRHDGDLFLTEKRRYDAFYGTCLQDMLRNLKVDTVVISGVMTNLCCETTARSAFVRDFNVIFLSDGTATADQKMHEATLTNIRFGFGKVMTCEEFRATTKSSP